VTVNSCDGVAFVDLAATHDQVRAQINEAWASVTSTNAFVGGSCVDRFESEFASYCGASHCVGVGSGTDALELILTALGVSQGDEVILPANTFIATAEAIVAVGATPVFVDVDTDTLLMTSEAVEAAITPATAGVVVVHLYGQTPDMAALCRVGEKHGILVLEDAAQAHGAAWGGRRAGTFGKAAAFSFHPAKNLGAFGDAGAVLTDDADLADRVRSLADHGRSRSSHHIHPFCGRNSRLDALQAAVLSVKLRYLDDWNASRRRAAAHYRTLLGPTSCQFVRICPRATAVHHLEVIRVDARDHLLSELTSRNIGFGLHYPVPCHRQDAFARYATCRLPVTEIAARQGVSLPMFPTISEREIERVCEAVLAAVEGNAHAA
jgi:dTDP-4-amino-4,6-dideoxygalactose transaminase